MNLSKVSTTLRKILPLQYCGAVIVAAGNASRMGGIDKVMAPLGGEPMIVRTVRAFQDAVAIKEKDFLWDILYDKIYDHVKRAEVSRDAE